jgi:hypothetical protein
MISNAVVQDTRHFYYKKAVRCTNYQKMLPLLLKEFLEAMHAKDHKDRAPLDFSKLGDSWKKGEIIELYINNARSQSEKTRAAKEVREISQKLEEGGLELVKVNEELNAHVNKLTKENTALQAVVTSYQSTLKAGDTAIKASSSRGSKSAKSLKISATNSEGSNAAVARSTATSETGEPRPAQTHPRPQPPRPQPPPRPHPPPWPHPPRLRRASAKKPKRGGLFRLFSKKTPKDVAVVADAEVGNDLKSASLTSATSEAVKGTKEAQEAAPEV